MSAAALLGPLGGRFLARGSHGLLRRGHSARGMASQSPTPLTSTFDGRPALAAARVLNRISDAASPDRGLFLIPELTSAEGFSAIKDDCVRRSAELVREACDPNRGRIVAAVFDDLSDELCRVADMAEFVRVAHPDPATAAAAEDACIQVSGLVEKLNTHLGLYESLRKAVEDGDSFPETDVDRHVAKLFLLDFKQCGIHLDDEARQVVVRLTDHVLQIGQQFSAGAHQPRVVKKSSVPSAVRHYFQSDGGDSVVLGGLHVDSRSDQVREAAYRLYYWNNPRQEELLRELLTGRARLARLCGYETYAHRVMSESLAGCPENVRSFLSHLSADLKPRLEDDFVMMFNMKKHANPLSPSLQVWDVPYYTVQAKNAWFDIPDAVCEYFSLGVCMEGLNTVFKSIFGVELRVETPEAGEVWHSDVYKLAVVDTAGGGDELLGHIYCDFFARPGKPHQDCHFTIRGGRRTTDGHYQNPAVVLMLSLPPATWGAPTLLSGPMIDNLFHEMGHAMHSMLGRTAYQHVTGTRCSTDFAEVPSTLMEYFASEPRVLSLISRHYKTGERLPVEQARKFCAAKRAFSAVEVHTQLFYSLVDQAFHQASSSSGEMGSTLDVVRSIHEEHHPLPYHGDACWHHRFSHLVGYGARYYSYLMARAVATSVWQKFFRDDPLSPDAGARYRRECLAHGGGKPSARLVSDLLDLERLDVGMLAEAVVSEIDANNANMRDLL